MSFGQPVFLVGLALVPLALAAYVRHEHNRRLAVDAFAAPAVRASVAPSTPGWRRHAPLAVYGVALTVLLVALARPQTTVAVPVERASIMLTTDYSGSMQATDVAPTRLAAARAAAERFLHEVPASVRVGLVSFNQAAKLVSNPTTDRAPLLQAIASLQPSGATATGEALAVSLTALASETDAAGVRVPSAIVLLSDGKSTRGRRPQEAAQRAKELKIPIYTVTLGTAAGTITVKRPDGSTETKPVPPDPAESSEVARISGGRAFTADQAEELSSVYQQLGSRIGYRHERRELTAAFGGGALALLASGSLLSLYWFRRLV
ncbi:MAG: Ca-activated chloride channel [Solirubrobacteraceae bacterium]|jgi:Ca-activated chloride channel family protein|nr:Ca-activated chloride channel [Solirubrobacteraceae bacterium]